MFIEQGAFMLLTTVVVVQVILLNLCSAMSARFLFSDAVTCTSVTSSVVNVLLEPE